MHLVINKDQGHWYKDVCVGKAVVCFNECKRTHGEIGFIVSQKLLNEDNVMHDTKVGDECQCSINIKVSSQQLFLAEIVIFLSHRNTFY